jgi:CBS domain-containing protein
VYFVLVAALIAVPPFSSHAIVHLLSNAEGKFLCIGMQIVEERQERITERQCLKWFFW